jgi:hypothetical protein
MMKILHNFFYNKLYFQNLFILIVFTKNLNFCCNFALTSTSYTKLEKGLHLIRRSLDQFLFIKLIYLSYSIANDIS